MTQSNENCCTQSLLQMLVGIEQAAHAAAKGAHIMHALGRINQLQKAAALGAWIAARNARLRFQNVSQLADVYDGSNVEELPTALNGFKPKRHAVDFGGLVS